MPLSILNPITPIPDPDPVHICIRLLRMGGLVSLAIAQGSMLILMLIMLVMVIFGASLLSPLPSSFLPACLLAYFALACSLFPALAIGVTTTRLDST